MEFIVSFTLPGYNLQKHYVSKNKIDIEWAKQEIIFISWCFHYFMLNLFLGDGLRQSLLNCYKIIAKLFKEITLPEKNMYAIVSCKIFYNKRN